MNNETMFELFNKNSKIKSKIIDNLLLLCKELNEVNIISSNRNEMVKKEFISVTSTALKLIHNHYTYEMSNKINESTDLFNKFDDENSQKINTYRNNINEYTKTIEIYIKIMEENIEEMKMEADE
jgi:hypothetical protein